MRDKEKERERERERDSQYLRSFHVCFLGLTSTSGIFDKEYEQTNQTGIEDSEGTLRFIKGTSNIPGIQHTSTNTEVSFHFWSSLLKITLSAFSAVCTHTHTHAHTHTIYTTDAFLFS